MAIAAVTLLAMTGLLQLWHLAAAAFLLGVGAAFFFPAYSAILPRILPPEDLLAANGMEGTMRPLLQQAAGPAVAGMVVASFSPGQPSAGSRCAICRPGHPEPAPAPAPDPGTAASVSAEDEPTAKRSSVLADLREGVSYTLKTPWLLWTLLWAVVSVLIFIGPIEVLLPFAVADQLGGDSKTFGFLLGIFGIGGAVGALITASLRLPRRYLSVMLLCWGAGALPIAVIGFTDSFWVMAVALFVVGATGSAGQVIWGTLLQRRVPSHLLGRISSLDFFVSLALMPVSMALAGPLGEVVPIWLIFLAAGTVCPVMAAVAMAVARMPADELAHPLDHGQVDGQIDDLAADDGEVDGREVDGLADAPAPAEAQASGPLILLQSNAGHVAPMSRGMTGAT